MSGGTWSTFQPIPGGALQQGLANYGMTSGTPLALPGTGPQMGNVPLLPPPAAAPVPAPVPAPPVPGVALDFRTGLPVGGPGDFTIQPSFPQNAPRMPSPVAGIPGMGGGGSPLAPTSAPRPPSRPDDLNTGGTTQDPNFWNRIGLWDQDGLNWENAGHLLSGIGSIADIWSSFQQNRLARQQFDFNRNAWNANFDNQIQSYNTSLEDRIRARYSQEGGTREQIDANTQANYEENRLRERSER